MKENASIEGSFSLVIKDKEGKVIKTIKEKNLIVNGGRNSAARLIGGGGGGKQITQIAVGTSGTAASLPDSDLTDKFIKAVTSVSYPQTGAVTFAFEIGVSEANGMAIREFGLFSADNSLFARKVRDVINKTSDISLEGTWTIQF
jgi:hypothetical protein